MKQTQPKDLCGTLLCSLINAENTHDFQPVDVDGKMVPECSKCGHRWYGKGEAKKPCKAATRGET